MSRKTPLPRYRTSHLSRKDLEEGAWRGTSPDYRTTIKGVPYVFYEGTTLHPLSELPDAELLDRYLRAERRSLQSRARAQDLGLFELNPDDPESSILWADDEVLSRMRSGWELMYVQPSHHDEHELLLARMYAQVVAALHPHSTSRELVTELRDLTNYAAWKKLERSGIVVRNEAGDLSFKVPEGVLVRQAGRTFRVHGVRDVTPEEMDTVGLDPGDSHLYFAGVPAGSSEPRVYRRSMMVDAVGLARLAELHGARD